MQELKTYLNEVTNVDEAFVSAKKRNTKVNMKVKQAKKTLKYLLDVLSQYDDNAAFEFEMGVDNGDVVTCNFSDFDIFDKDPSKRGEEKSVVMRNFFF